MKLSDLSQNGPVDAAMAFGRFQPPHLGHVALFKAVQQASQSGIWYIGTSQTTYNKSNPLPWAIKQHWMLALDPKLAGHLVAQTNVLTLAAKIYHEHPTVKILKYITDDTDWAWSGKLLNQYNGKEAKDEANFFKFHSIIHVPSPRLSSATDVRNAVAADNPKAFYLAVAANNKAQATRLQKIKINGLDYFSTVKQAMADAPASKKLEEMLDLSRDIQFHDKLNPALWTGTELDPEVAEHLMQIAYTFEKFLDAPELEVEDVTISGSNAAFTYTQYSDIDLHLLITVSKEDQPLIKKYIDAKKTLFNENHDILVRDQPVEVYVQFTDEPHTSAGIYSVKNQTWIKQPQKIEAAIDHQDVRSKVREYVKAINQAIKTKNITMAEKVWDRLKEYRKQGLSVAGELSTGNFTFKILRNHDYIEKLLDFRREHEDQELSLDKEYK